ncbi:unnamed protein product [Effrenium voratum]|nr:unnamed protein product [Effrenium voratum]
MWKMAARLLLSAAIFAGFLGLQSSFLTIDSRPRETPVTPTPALRGPSFAQGPAAARDTAISWTTALPALLAVGAVVAMASRARDGTCTTMYGGHDKKTFRGKLHAHTFGKHRLRKNKARRIQQIKNGTFDPEKVVQRGQPEPEHPWDTDNLLENPIYYSPDYVKEVMYQYWDEQNEAMRKKHKEYMGIKGNQRFFKNWTPA